MMMFKVQMKDIIRRGSATVLEGRKPSGVRTTWAEDTETRAGEDRAIVRTGDTL